jgi:hypothetical protein
LKNAGFYSMVFENADTVQFVLIDEERGQSEWGLKKWTPAKQEEYIADAELNYIFPKTFIQGIAFPVVLKEKKWSTSTLSFFNCTINEIDTFSIKRGIGSCNVFNPNSNTIQLKTFNSSKTIECSLSNAVHQVISEDIETPKTFARNSILHITNDIEITGDGKLEIEEGTLIVLDEGVTVTHSAPLIFKGTANNPILVTCTNGDKYFGGFVSNNESASVSAAHAFFTRFGYNTGTVYDYGHAHRQALFKSKNINLSFENCYFIDSPGQVFYPENCELDLNACIVQRTKTGGQLNNSTVTIDNSYFSDFPNDNSIYLDEDNDAIYVNASDVKFSNSMFMYTKDDGIDTGGSGGGTVEINSCRIEACFHEGVSMSSKNLVVKSHSIRNTIISNCQQGVELGYSSPNHKVSIVNCTFQDNYIGIRYGDNYEDDVDGRMQVSGSVFYNNEKSYWNMVHQIWAAKSSNLIIDNTNEFNNNEL